MSYFRKSENRPVLTGRAAHRADQRCQARNAQRPGLPVIGHQQRAIVAAANAGHVQVREYLQSIGFTEWARFESAFGRQVAKTYRANHSTSPDRGGKVILHGRIWSTLRYSNPLDVAAGALAYPRTRDLVLTSVTGHPVARQYASA